MESAKKFEKDVFISYTHKDNRPLTKEQKGWITSFHYSLRMRLEEMLGRKALIWRDNKLQGNDEFSEEIVAQLSKTKVLLLVLSPGYIQSEWCLRELQEFISGADKAGGLHISNKSRLFKIVKTPVPYEQHPDNIRGLLAYEFYGQEPDDLDHHFYELNSEEGNPYNYNYHQKVLEVAQDLWPKTSVVL